MAAQSLLAGYVLLIPLLLKLSFLDNQFMGRCIWRTCSSLPGQIRTEWMGQSLRIGAHRVEGRKRVRGRGARRRRRSGRRWRPPDNLVDAHLGQHHLPWPRHAAPNESASPPLLFLLLLLPLLTLDLEDPGEAELDRRGRCSCSPSFFLSSLFMLATSGGEGGAGWVRAVPGGWPAIRVCGQYMGLGKIGLGGTAGWSSWVRLEPGLVEPENTSLAGAPKKP